MLRKMANMLIDLFVKEIPASNLSQKKEVILGDRSAKELRSGIEDLHARMFDASYASEKFGNTIQSYRESIRK